MPLLRIGALAAASAAEGVARPSERSKYRQQTDIYVAAPVPRRKDAYALGLALKLARPSARLVSTWLERCVNSDTTEPNEQQERELVLWENIRDIERSDVVIALTWEDTPKSTIGDIVWALAIGTPVIWVTRGREGRNIWDAHWAVRRVETADPLRSVVEIATAMDEVICARRAPRLDREEQGARFGTLVDGLEESSNERPSIIVDGEELRRVQQESDALALALTEALEAYPDTQRALREWAAVLAMPAPPSRLLMAARSALRVAESRHPATYELARACRDAHKRLCSAGEHLELALVRGCGEVSS
jgi:hypothetical protein